jgi:prepilin-type N-terminal cleavage/methylation domain-containing protein
MRGQRGYSLIELIVATGVVAIVCTVLVLGFSTTMSLAYVNDSTDIASLEAHNVAVSLRAAMAYDRGAVAAVGAVSPQTYTIAQPNVSIVTTQAGTVLNLQVMASPASVTVAVPLAQEVPFPQSTVLGSY